MVREMKKGAISTAKWGKSRLEYITNDCSYPFTCRHSENAVRRGGGSEDDHGLLEVNKSAIRKICDTLSTLSVSLELYP